MMSSSKKGVRFKNYIIWSVILVILMTLVIYKLQVSQTIKQLSEKSISSTPPAAAQKIDGLYKGDLPCADCPGITETLILATDGSYILEDLYQGKSDKSFKNPGKWEIVKSDILKLSPEDGSQDSYFQVLENGNLQMLDLKMQKIDSPFNSILTKSTN